MQAIIDRFEDEQFQFPDAVKVGMLRADPEAMLACQAPELVSEGIPSFEGFPVPVLLIAGAREDEEGGAATIASVVAHGKVSRCQDSGTPALARPAPLRSRRRERSLIVGSPRSTDMNVKLPRTPDRPSRLAATDEPPPARRVRRRRRGGVAQADRRPMTAEELERVLRRYPGDI